MLSFPEVVSTARRTGRAELDEHAQDVHAAEIDVRLRPTERSKEAFVAELRTRLSTIPGMVTTIGGPLAHRIDHMASGTRASIAIKIFGDDLAALRTAAQQVEGAMKRVDGVVELAIEQQVEVPQLGVVSDCDAIARYGLRAGQLAEIVETAYAGTTVTRVLEGQRTYALVVRYRDDQRSDVDIRTAIERDVKLPAGYYVEYGGQFESEQAASRTILLLGLLVVAGIFVILFLAFRSLRNALLIMINLPLALIGGIVAVFAVGGVLSVASLVGFITLFGIATRNGTIMISHYEHLQRTEGTSFAESVARGSMERLSPVLMTALCAGLALVPLVLAGAEPGNELQAPMGVVILGGLLTSTVLNMIVIPALYARFASRRTGGASTVAKVN